MPFIITVLASSTLSLGEKFYTLRLGFSTVAFKNTVIAIFTVYCLLAQTQNIKGFMRPKHTQIIKDRLILESN